MNSKERMDKLNDLLGDMEIILQNKGHDYGDTEDALSNFKLSELLGIPAYKGILIRMGDKYSRLTEFAKKGEFKVDDESFKDTCLDLANYALLCYLCYLEDNENKARQLPPVSFVGE